MFNIKIAELHLLMNAHHFLAFDLGAESGRVILGTLDKQELSLKEVYRFPNGYVSIHGRLYWNIYTIFTEFSRALAVCSHQYTNRIDSLAFDTWGVDFGLLSKEGLLLSNPFSYRDPFTNGMVETFSKQVMPLDKLYQLTGIQTMQINTLFQIYALKRSNSTLLSTASDLLFMPDLLNYFFTGEKKTEYSIASTSQLLDPYTKKWNRELFNAIGVPVTIMQEVIPQEQNIGYLDKNIRQSASLNEVRVVSVASHDTGSAIVAVPAEDKNWAFLSSGTWSLMGLELTMPIITRASSDLNFTNEGGADGTYRFLKNMCGLWLLQQYQKKWDPDKSYSYDQIVQMATDAKPLKAIIDIDASEFLNPDDISSVIRDYCIQTGQDVPESPAEYLRCIFDSMAMKYRLVMHQLKNFSPQAIDKLYVIGGGSKNRLLCQLTADAIGMPVHTGPVEATAIGNIMMQAKALGYVHSLSEIRMIVRNSFESVVYLPKETSVWEKKEKLISGIFTQTK